MRLVSGIALFAIGIAGIPAAHGQEPTYQQLLAAFEKKLVNVAATAGPSIATIVVSRSEHYPKSNDDTPGKLGGFDPKEFIKSNPTPGRIALAQSLDLSDIKGIPDHGYAGGVVIDTAGYVLTPYHVIDGATRIYVFLPGGTGSYADIRAADARSDLAVLKMIAPPPNLKAIKFADVRTVPVGPKKATVETGKLCVLMANPYSSRFGIGQPSASFGSITNVHASRRSREPEFEPARRYTEYGMLLQYDVKLNDGVTGSILLNLDGEMIGLTNAAAVAWGKDIGPGYAIPADERFKKIVDVLRRGEEVEYGFLGVRPLNPRLGAGIDQRAIDPIPGGAAALARIHMGDAIAKINGVPIQSWDDLLLHIGSALAGTKVKLTIVRDNQQIDVEVELAKLKNLEPFIASVKPEPVFGLWVDYGSVLTAADASYVKPGVAVREVVAGSPTEAKFKPLGDDPKRWLITDVNGAPVTTPSEFYRALRGQKKIALKLTDSTQVNNIKELTLP